MTLHEDEMYRGIKASVWKRVRALHAVLRLEGYQAGISELLTEIVSEGVEERIKSLNLSDVVSSVADIE